MENVVPNSDIKGVINSKDKENNKMARKKGLSDVEKGGLLILILIGVYSLSLFVLEVFHVVVDTNLVFLVSAVIMYFIGKRVGLL